MSLSVLIHGLSTAYHLAIELKAKGSGSGADILVIDKTSIWSNRNSMWCCKEQLLSACMRELMAHSVSVWESDPKAYSYHPVGYMQISSESMHEDIVSIYEQQKSIGYSSC